ncbi:MAG: hypothetical protein D6710_09350 [Nitrospirae bacterium]|nr:MAG: hypothetical protein D6710_09350 [Nitrospirota bacterium]
MANRYSTDAGFIYIPEVEFPEDIADKYAPPVSQSQLDKFFMGLRYYHLPNPPVWRYLSKKQGKRPYPRAAIPYEALPLKMQEMLGKDYAGWNPSFDYLPDGTLRFNGSAGKLPWGWNTSIPCNRYEHGPNCRIYLASRPKRRKKKNPVWGVDIFVSRCNQHLKMFVDPVDGRICLHDPDSFLYYMAFRVLLDFPIPLPELLNIRVSDVHIWDKENWICVKRKGKPVYLQVPNKLLPLYRAYFAYLYPEPEQMYDPSDPFIRNEVDRKTPLKVRWYYFQFEKCKKALNVDIELKHIREYGALNVYMQDPNVYIMKEVYKVNWEFLSKYYHYVQGPGINRSVHTPVRIMPPLD